MDQLIPDQTPLNNVGVTDDETVTQSYQSGLIGVGAGRFELLYYDVESVVCLVLILNKNLF